MEDLKNKIQNQYSFKVGDRVMVISPPDGKRSLVGKIGKVILTRDRNTYRLPILVNFDESITETSHFTWYCESESLVLVSKYIDPRIGILKK